ncbi:MAG: FkbM family methyltransferase [Desulfobaccales bacterium]|nr:FkbM family methyltransferase [Desulfobaccales bacterium]
MSENWLKATVREIFRWYLSKFPLRDGKAYFYKLFHRHLAPAERYVTVRLDKGFKMKLDLKDEEQKKIYFYGHYHERYEADLVQRLLDADEVFWDIGANVGYFSLVAATALNNSGQILAFEPGRLAYERLLDNISLNPFTNIKTFQLAVAATEGEAVLYLSADIADSSASLYHPGKEPAGRQVCMTISLDKFLVEQGLRPPGFLKIDVEGAELAVLQGAPNLIAAYTPLLLMEMEEKNLAAAGASKADIQQLLTGYGYRAAHLRQGRWRLIDDVAEARGRNIFWFNPALPKHRQKAGRVLNLG